MTSALFASAVLAQAQEQESRATFHVIKAFTDNNRSSVEVHLSCDTGIPLEQTKIIVDTDAHEDGVDFVVVDFDDGELDCVVTETPVTGYTTTYTNRSLGNVNRPDGCFYDDVGFEDDNSCVVVNELNRVSIVVRKIWIDDNPQFNGPNYARARWNCWNSGYQIGADDPAAHHQGCAGDTCGSLSFYGADDTDSFYVYPDWDGTTWCSVEERVFESGVVSTRASRR
jgi:hypothetical protein